MGKISSFTDKSGGIVRRGRPFIKMHGLRNDFVIVDGRDQPCQPTAEEIVRIFNPDGREVAACGNATRCLGWLFLQESKRQAVVIDTLGGRLG